MENIVADLQSSRQ